MNESIVKVELIKAIQGLEESGDIVVVNPIENAVADKLFNSVQNVSPNMLSNTELGGIINSQIGVWLRRRRFPNRYWPN